MLEIGVSFAISTLGDGWLYLEVHGPLPVQLVSVAWEVLPSSCTHHRGFHTKRENRVVGFACNLLSLGK